MSLPVYQELPCQLDDKGNGSVSFTPFVTYGTASVILSVTGAILTGQGYISLGNNPLGPCALAQGFGPFNVQYGQPVNIAITGGPPNALLQLALKGAIYIPGESTPGENLQFSAVTQQNSNVLVFKQNIALTGTVIYGPFEVSKFAGLNLLCEVNGQAQAVLSWTDVDGVTPLGASQWDLAKDLTGNGVYKAMDVAANLGPKVTLEIIPNGATEIASVSLVPSSVPLIGPSGTTLNAVAQISATVADGANATGLPSFVTAGPAVLSLVNEFDGKSWELQVFYVKADQSTHLIVSHVGNTKDYQVGISLPSAPCVIKYYNNAGDGTSQQVEVQLIKSSKGTGVGLPGPQGPQGPAGPGGSSIGKALPDSNYGTPVLDFDALNGQYDPSGFNNAGVFGPGILDLWTGQTWKANLYNAAGFNGKPALVFNSTSSAPGSIIGYPAPQAQSLINGFTLIALCSLATVASDIYAVLGTTGDTAGGTTGPIFLIFDTSTSPPRMQIGAVNKAGFVECKFTPTVNTPYIVTVCYHPIIQNFSYFRVNQINIPLSSWTANSPDLSTSFQPAIGQYGSGATPTLFFNGSIAKLLLLDAPISATQVNVLETSFRSTWGF